MADNSGTVKLIVRYQAAASKTLLLLAVLFLAGSIQAAGRITNTIGPNQLDAGHEAILVNALENIRHGNIPAATEGIRLIVETYPNYRLAQLIYADLLMAQSRPIRDFGNFQSAPYVQISALLEEARARWQHYRTSPSGNMIPASLVKLGPNRQNAVVVDLHASRLYLYENIDGIPRLVRDFYATIGKNGTGKYEEGDQKTPVGVYFVTGFINPEDLPDLYGDGAFPIDYPNIWDRRHGRTGYGIWLHGTPSNTFSRPPRDSDGCVILSNGDLQLLAPYIRENTPVILTDEIRWLDTGRWWENRDQYDALVEQWKGDWESRDAGRYLRHYSATFSGLGMDYPDWVDHKKRVNPAKRYIRIGISEKSIFRYPGEDDLIVITFRQEYDSDNYRTTFIKRQYWQREKDGRWRIVYEGSAS